MSSLKPLEKTQVADLLGLASGYVLGDEFSNPSFQKFIWDLTNLDIFDAKFATYGESKGKRLRAFIEQESDTLVGIVLDELVQLWAYRNPLPRAAQEQSQFEACRRIVDRLLGEDAQKAETESDFLKKDLGPCSFDKVPIDGTLLPILQARYDEAIKCLSADAALASIFLSGSVLEGLLLGMASSNPQLFNQAQSSPKDADGRVLKFPNWSLAQFIDVSYELGFLPLDVKKFSHELRDFRNYIHPYEQMRSSFNPDQHTAEICLKVLRAAIASLSRERVC